MVRKIEIKAPASVPNIPTRAAMIRDPHQDGSHQRAMCKMIGPASKSLVFTLLVSSVHLFWDLVVFFNRNGNVCRKKTHQVKYQPPSLQFPRERELINCGNEGTAKQSNGSDKRKTLKQTKIKSIGNMCLDLRSSQKISSLIPFI